MFSRPHRLAVYATGKTSHASKMLPMNVRGTAPGKILWSNFTTGQIQIESG